MSTSSFKLRPFEEADLELLTRFVTDPGFSGPFEWAGFVRSPTEFRRRWEEDRFLGKDPRSLAIGHGSDRALGWVSFSQPGRDAITGGGYGPYEIGAFVDPEYRGVGVGTTAQRLLVELLFATTTTHRVVAYTEIENLAERRALEKVGFRQEGVLRSAICRRGGWHDLAAYGLLRCDQPDGATPHQ